MTEGNLKSCPPLLEHDDDGRFLGDLFFVLTEELGIPFKRGGSRNRPPKHPASRSLPRAQAGDPPVGVDFEIVDADRIVWALSAWDTGKIP